MSPATPDTPAASGAPPAKQPPDLKLASNILIQLNIVRKNSRIYADGHPALQASVRRTLQLLGEFFANAEAFSLAVTRDSLLLGDHEFPRQNVIIAELVSYLHNQSIYVFTLKRGITEEEFLQVNRLLSSEGKTLLSGTPLDEAVARLAGGHAEIRLIDWTASEFTDETEIDLAKQARDAGSGESSWESFIRHLLQQDAEDLPAWMVGPSPLDSGEERLAAVQSQAGQAPDRGTVDRRASEECARKPGAAEADTDWNRVRRVATAVEPGLRTELLQGLPPPASPSAQEAVHRLEEKDSQLVLEVLESLSRTGLPIHPKALRLVEALAECDPAGLGWRLDQLDSHERDFSEPIRTLLSVSGFPDPPSTQGSGEAPPKGEDELSRAAASAAATWSRDIPRHYAATLLDLLQAAPKSGAAETCARALADRILISALEGDWETVTAGWIGLDELAARTDLASPIVPECCRKAKMQFGDTEKLSRLAAALLAYGIHQTEGLGEILRLAGQSLAQPLVETLALEEREPAQRALIPLVIDLKDHTLSHVIRLLDDPRGPVVCRMLLVLQQMGDQGVLRRIEKLLLHGERQVRLEALRTLTLLGSPRAPALLLRAIRDPDEQLSVGAIAIAPHASHPEITQTLLAIAKDPRRFKRAYDLPRKSQAVRSLIATGRVEVFPDLYRLAAKRPLFHAKAFRRLRAEIFRALAQADVPVPGDFLRLGRSLRDAEIANVCREIERRLRAGARPSQQAERQGTSK
jgi:HEAT repeat protein